MTWTPERTELAKTLWLKGQTAEQIARRIGGTSRNAVIGKMHRLGLKRDNAQQHRLSGQQSAKRFKRRNQRKSTSGTALDGPRYVRVPIPKEDAPKGPLVMFADLEPHHCRAPYGDPKQPGFGFCGCAIVPGTSYCAEHLTRFTQAPIPERRATPFGRDTYAQPDFFVEQAKAPKAEQLQLLGAAE